MSAADYQRRADTYRPQSVEAMHEAIDQLYAEGLRPRDISTALRVSLDVVINHLFHEGP